MSGMAEGRISGSGLAWGSAQFLSTFLLSPFLGCFERGLEGTRLWTEEKDAEAAAQTAPPGFAEKL